MPFRSGQPQTNRVNIYVKSNMQILMEPGQSCCVLVILLAAVNFQHGGEDRCQGRDSQWENPRAQGKEVSAKIP